MTRVKGDAKDPRHGGIAMIEITFLAGVPALLLTPGPTNTLLAVAGTAGGWRVGLRLAPAAMAAYALAVVPLALYGRPLFAAAPVLGDAVRLAAALWVLALAVSLWRAGDRAGPVGPIGPGTVFVTTLLNPKALVFGLVLLPSGPALWPHLVVFLACVGLAAALWAGLGACLTRPNGRWDCLARRGAAAFLALVSAGLVGGMLA